MPHTTTHIAQLLAAQAGEVRQHLKQLAMLNNSGQNIQNSIASLPDLLRGILRTAKALTGARYAALGVFDATGERLAQFFTEGIDDETRQAIGPLPTGRGLLGALIKEEGALRLKDIRRHQESAGFPPHHPVMQSFLGKSIRAHGKLFGRIYLTDKILPRADESAGDVSACHTGEFTDLDEQLITALAFQAGTAIETAGLIEEIRAAQSRDRAVLDSVAEGIFGIDLAGRCLFLNKACTDALGYAEGELIGRNIHAMIHHTREDGTPFPEAECPILGALHRQQRCRLENEILWRKDGTSFPATYTVTSLRNESGTVTGAVVSFMDCTEYMQRRQGQKMEALGYLASGVAHDFNNLLTVVNGYTELLLLQTDLSASTRMKIDEIQKATDRATALTGRLLAFGRQKPLERKAADINDLVRGMESLLHRLLGDDIALCLDLFEARCFAKIDVGGIEQALINLVVNARDAMPTGGLMEIRTTIRGQAAPGQSPAPKPGDPSIVIEVSDSGEGMDKTVQDRIFEPFFTTKARGGGTGLGLATVYRIVMENEGGIQVTSKPGAGTTFIVTLPLVEPPEDRPERPVVSTPIQGGEETVLLVEDHVDVQMLVTTMLENNGYRVLTANNGREGEHVVRTYEGAIHLVIADVMMPHMGGRAMARSVRAQRPDLKVLFITGGTDAEVARYGELLTDGDVLAKPFTNEALLKAVGRALDRRGGRPVLPGAPSKPKRILLLDDDHQVGSLLREMLKSEGYEVVILINGAESIRLLRQEPVDLLITDMLMPDMDGIEVIREARHLLPSLKILAMSGGGIGATPEVYLTLAQQLGVTHTLAKPFSREQLLVVVHEMMD